MGLMKLSHCFQIPKAKYCHLSCSERCFKSTVIWWTSCDAIQIIMANILNLKRLFKWMYHFFNLLDLFKYNFLHSLFVCSFICCRSMKKSIREIILSLRLFSKKSFLSITLFQISNLHRDKCYPRNSHEKVNSKNNLIPLRHLIILF